MISAHAETQVSTPAGQAISGCLDALSQCRRLVSSLSEDDYAARVGGHSSIGAHMRHCLDHFVCMLRGLDETGEVDYDSRDRSPEIETRLAAFETVMTEIESRLRSLKPGDVSRPLRVTQIPAPNAAPITVGTTVERELLFLSSHCIHHLALMRLLAEMRGAGSPPDVGVAFSTIAYREGLNKPSLAE